MKYTKNELKAAALALKYKRKIQDALKSTAEGKKGKGFPSETWIGDLADHIKVCNLLINNPKSLSHLDKVLWNLDTDSRERFPRSLWNLIPE